MDQQTSWASSSGALPWKGLGAKDRCSWQILFFLVFTFHIPVHITGLKVFPSGCSLSCIDFQEAHKETVLRRNWWHWCLCYTDPQEVALYQQTTPSQYCESASASKRTALGFAEWPFQVSISSSCSSRKRDHLRGFPVGCITVYIPLELPQFLDIGGNGKVT